MLRNQPMGLLSRMRAMLRGSLAGPIRPATFEDLSPAMQTSLVEFVRDWLPEPVAAVYREMILADPEGWSRDPHFAGGVILDGALRGNGITEKTVGVTSLELIWPEVLRRAVLTEQEATGGRAAPRR